MLYQVDYRGRPITWHPSATHRPHLPQLFVPVICPIAVDHAAHDAAVSIFKLPRKGIRGSLCSCITPAQHAGDPGFKPQRVHIVCTDGVFCQVVFPIVWPYIQANASVDSEDRTHDLRIMGPTRCQLRYIHLSFVAGAHMAATHTRISTWHQLLHDAPAGHTHTHTRTHTTAPCSWA